MTLLPNAFQPSACIREPQLTLQLRLRDNIVAFGLSAVQIAAKRERPRASAAHSPARKHGPPSKPGIKSKRPPLSRTNSTESPEKLGHAGMATRFCFVCLLNHAQGLCLFCLSCLGMPLTVCTPPPLCMVPASGPNRCMSFPVILRLFGDMRQWEPAAFVMRTVDTPRLRCYNGRETAPRVAHGRRRIFLREDRNQQREKVFSPEAGLPNEIWLRGMKAAGS